MDLVRYFSKRIKINCTGGVLAGTYVMASRVGFISITMEETDQIYRFLAIPYTLIVQYHVDFQFFLKSAFFHVDDQR